MKLVIEMPYELYKDCMFMKDIQEKQFEHNMAFRARSLFEMQLVNCVASGTPLPKGHWIEVDNGYICSECDIIRAKGTTGKYNYCPNCGARMTKVKEEYKQEIHIDKPRGFQGHSISD